MSKKKQRGTREERVKAAIERNRRIEAQIRALPESELKNKLVLYLMGDGLKRFATRMIACGLVDGATGELKLS